MDSFTCPQCGIEQEDICLEYGQLLIDSETCWTTYICRSCGEALDLEDIGPFAAKIKRREIYGLLVNLALYIFIFAALGCWLL